MRYRSVGTTGVKISEIGFGCGNNAVLMVHADYDSQLKTVQRALDLGINFFDTAFLYGLGKSEQNLGRILGELGADPVISTKIRLEPRSLGDLKATTIEAVEAGLGRLDMRAVEFVQLHTPVAFERSGAKRFCLTPSEVLGPGGVLEGFKAMRDLGKVRHFGFTGLGEPQALLELVDSGEFHGFQAYYNLLNPSSGHRVGRSFGALNYGEIIERAAAHGMGAFAIRILAAGALTSDPGAGGGSSPEALSPGSDYASDLRRAEKLRLALGIDGERLTQAAIRFGLMNPAVSSVVVGFSNPAQVEEAVACSGAPPLRDDEIRRIAKLWETDFAD